MRLIRLVFLVAIGLGLIVLALANRQMVTLKVLPQELSGMFNLSNQITLPLFLVILLGVLLGLLIGFVMEYFREHKHRRDLSEQKREVKGLRREVQKLKEQTGEAEDEILALLEK